MIVTVIYAKQSLCKCGYPILLESVPLGTEYKIDLEDLGKGTMHCGGCGTLFECTAVWVVSGGVTNSSGYLPMEIFQIERAAAHA